MAFQTVFKRYELKYMITREQQAMILRAMEPHMIPDKFGRSTIRNIYFDTDDHILARHSIAKPDFKEKLRIRSYLAATPETTVFVELKRKADHLVYKRRVALPEKAAMNWTQGFTRRSSDPSRLSDPCRSAGPANCASQAVKEQAASAQAPAAGTQTEGSPVPTQMTREIDYFLSYYGHLRPAVFLSYDRTAYRMRDAASDFRVTFDENILFRDYDLSLESDVYGTLLLGAGKVLMEIKCSGGIPLWMTEVLSAQHIYKTSFSKYGTAYTQYILPAELRIRARAAQDALAQSSNAASSGMQEHGRHAAAAAAGIESGKTASRSTYPNSRRSGAGSKHAKRSRTAASWLHYLGA